jgi:hypothetical protein
MAEERQDITQFLAENKINLDELPSTNGQQIKVRDPETLRQLAILKKVT